MPRIDFLLAEEIQAALAAAAKPVALAEAERAADALRERIAALCEARTDALNALDVGFQTARRTGVVNPDLVREEIADTEAQIASTKAAMMDRLREIAQLQPQHAAAVASALAPIRAKAARKVCGLIEDLRTELSAIASTATIIKTSGGASTDLLVPPLLDRLSVDAFTLAAREGGL